MQNLVITYLIIIILLKNSIPSNLRVILINVIFILCRIYKEIIIDIIIIIITIE